MNIFTKTFIKDNRQKINDNEWYKVFEEWYNSAEDIWPDNEVVEEFINILTTSGIVIDFGARDKVLFDKFVELFIKIRNNNDEPEERFSSYYWLFNQVHSQLGYNHIKDILPIMRRAAKQCKFEDRPEEQGFKW